MRDRFTAELLAEYCGALGIDVFDPGYYSGPAVLIATSAPSTEFPELTLADAQRFLEIQPGMVEASRR